MNKKGIAPLIIILVIAILGVAGYFAYKSYYIKPQTSMAPSLASDLPVTGKITGRKIIVNVKGEGENRGKEATGTMTIPTGWEIDVGDDRANPLFDGVVLKHIYIKSGEYKITISSTGGMQAVCGYQDQTNGDLNTDMAVLFKDQSGYQYLREKPTSYSGQHLEICSNGFEGTFKQGFSASNAIFGDIHYEIPQNPDNKILNQMDNMVASFKNNQ